MPQYAGCTKLENGPASSTNIFLQVSIVFNLYLVTKALTLQYSRYLTMAYLNLLLKKTQFSKRSHASKFFNEGK